MAEAELARFIDRWTIEYVRTYPHPIERVWRAITDPKEFGQWFIRGDIELTEGGAFRFQSGDWTGKVAAIEPPRLIRFGDDLSWFEYALSEVAGGTRMCFTQRFDPALTYTPTPDDLGGDIPVPGTPWKPGFVGGWHAHFDMLGDLLDGVRSARACRPRSSRRWPSRGRATGSTPASSTRRVRRVWCCSSGARSDGTSSIRSTVSTSQRRSPARATEGGRQS